MGARALHLNSYFLFPFSVDKEAVRAAHPDMWPGSRRWLAGLDPWIATHRPVQGHQLVARLGPWQRDAYTRFDFDSRAYHEMVFFHPFVRRVFFDTQWPEYANDQSLLHCYRMAAPEGTKLVFETRDTRGESAAVDLTDLRCLCSGTEWAFFRSALRRTTCRFLRCSG